MRSKETIRSPLALQDHQVDESVEYCVPLLKISEFEFFIDNLLDWLHFITDDLAGRPCAIEFSISFSR